MKSFLRTNQVLEYQQRKNFYHLSMPNRQYEYDKTQEEKPVNRLVSMAMNDHYTTNQTKSIDDSLQRIETNLRFDITR